MTPAKAAVVVLMASTSVVAADPSTVKEPAPHHVYAGDWEHFVGGGIAAFDCDGDDLPELYAAGGSNPAQLLRNRSNPGGALQFVAETPDTIAIESVTGAYPLDIDSDGILDLAILRVGKNLLMRGGPDCGFEPFDIPGFDGGDGWTTAFSATWEAGQFLPTLAYGDYVNREDPKGPFRACDDNHLFRPDGEVFAHSTLSPGFCPLSMLFSDWNRSSRADLRISNDRHYYVSGGEEQLWFMEAQPRLATQEDGWGSYHLWGMGIASRDLDFDGYPEVYLTSMGDQRLQYHSGLNTPHWEDAPYELGATAHRPYSGGDGRPSTGWHVAFGDVQNDGRDDIFVAKGNVEQMPDSALDDPNNLLIQDVGGTFRETGETAGLASMHRARGAAFVDLNLDGLLDFAVVNRRAPLELYRNVTKDTGNWVAIELIQAAPNVRAVGAFIELDLGRQQVTREITVGGGHAGGAAVAEHFGLGPATVVRMRVIWSDGETSRWVQVVANRHISVGRTGNGLTVVEKNHRPAQ